MLEPKFTQEQVAKALLDSGGIRTKAAEALGCSRQTVANLIERWPDLLDVVARAEDETGDLAENGLRTLIQAGNLGSIIFYLKTKMKARGYTERQELTGANGGPIAVADVSKLTDDELQRIAAGDFSAIAGSGRDRTATATASAEPTALGK
jgi:hypothetical protein